MLASTFEVIWASARPASTSWKSRAGASTILCRAFGKKRFTYFSCTVPKVAATVTSGLSRSAQSWNRPSSSARINGTVASEK